VKRIFVRTGMAIVVLLTTLLTAAPVSAYNNPNADQILLRRMDAIRCGRKIRLAADVLDRRDAPVGNAQVRFRLIEGVGRLGPDSDRDTEYTVTGSAGRARPPANSEGALLPYLVMPCESRAGWRTVRASVPGSGAVARLRIYCGPSSGCTGGRNDI